MYRKKYGESRVSFGKKIARALASLNPTNYTTEESFITVGYDKNMN